MFHSYFNEYAFDDINIHLLTGFCTLQGFPYFRIFFSFLKHIPQVNTQIRQFLLNRLSWQIKSLHIKKEGKARLFCMTFSLLLSILFCLKYSDFLF